MDKTEKKELLKWADEGMICCQGIMDRKENSMEERALAQMLFRNFYISKMLLKEVKAHERY